MKKYIKGHTHCLQRWIFVSLLLVIHSVAGESIFAQTEIAYTPNVEKHPIALSTNSRNAALILYTQALPADDGPLEYQWYTSNVTTDYPLPLTNEAITAIKAGVQIIPGETHYNLSTTTPDAAGTYYYWCRVINTKGTRPFAESDLSKVIVVDRTLPVEIINGNIDTWVSDNLTNTGPAPLEELGSTRATDWYVMDARKDPANGWYTTHTDKWVDAYGTNNTNSRKIIGSGIGTLEAVTPTRSGVGTITYDGYNGPRILPDPDFGNFICELSADVPSSNYQDIATTSGKIYEWEFMVGARDAAGEAVALVIGPAINTAADYGDYTGATLIGRPTGWATPGNNIPAAATTYPNANNSDTRNTNQVVYRWVDRSSQPNAYNGNWNAGRPAVANQLLTGEKVYRYGMDLATGVVTAKTMEQETVGGRARVKMPTYFNDILKKTADVHNRGANDAFVIGNRYTLGTTKQGQNFVTNYNNRNYYVSIATAQAADQWNRYSGVYSVPEGQGTTVFAFAFIPPVGTPATATNGNLFDNVVFKTGTPPEFNIDMFYSGLVTLSAITRPDYVYGIAEVRGSAVYAPDASAIAVTFNDNPITPYDFGDASIEHWYFPEATGTITFSNMVPGKTYRIVGIPRGAVSGQDQLNTNRTPALVLDDGYYEEVTIQGTSSEDGNQMSTVGARDTLIYLTNSNPGVQYALLDDALAPGEEGRVVHSWRTGLGLETGQSLFFTGLERNHCYLLAVRPAGWNEITYEIAAASASMVRVCTPYIDDIKLEQVSRVPSTEQPGKDKIIIRQARGNISNGISDTGEHVITRRNEYHYYDGKTGVISVEEGAFVPETAEEGDPLFVEFDGLEPGAIYHVIVRDLRAPKDFGNSTSFLVGVRVYPIVPPYLIDYEQERVAYEDGGPIPNEELVEKVEYRMRAHDEDSTWLIGDAGSFVVASGNDYINMGQRQGGNPSLLDRMWILGADTAVIESRFVDLWPISQFPSVFPLSYFKVPRRPEAPVATACDESVPSPDYTVDYFNEEIIVDKGLLTYSTNNGANFATPLSQGSKVSFGTLGWSGAERTVPLRIPAVPTVGETEGSFASESNMQTILARGPAPLEPYAKIVDGFDPPQEVEILNLDPNRKYQYRLQNILTPLPWNDISGIDKIVLEYETGIDYEIRYAAECDKPASLYRLLSMPLSLVPVDFGNVVYGYDPEDLTDTIVIRNVADIPVLFSEIILVNCTKNGELLPGDCDLFEIIGEESEAGGTVPGAENGAEGENKNSLIKPKGNLSVGTYRATLELVYSYEDNSEKRTTTEVFLNITKATRENPLEAVSFNPTENSFGIEISFVPEDAIIEYRINTEPNYTEGDKGEEVTDVITGLASASTYTVYYRLKESENYYETEPKSLTVCTAFPTKNVTYVNYIEEILYFNSGEYETYYEVRVNDDVVVMPYKLSAEADLGDIKISVSQIGPQGNPNCEYPPSVPYEYTVTGRADAPVVTLTGEDENIINVADGSRRFEYRRGRRTEFWTPATGTSTDPLRWGSYQVRYIATATPAVFASRSITVFILPDLEPTDRKLYVDIDVDPGVSNGNGSSWVNATPSLSAALEYTRIEHPSPVDSIFVATGHIPYTSEISTADGVEGEHNRAFVLPDSVVISGGYDASTGLPNAAPTILSGKLEDVTGNSYHVVVAGNAAETTLNRFVITDGRAEGEGYIDIGVSNEGVGDAIEHQTVFRKHGGGLYVSGSSHLYLINVLIHSNEAEGNGGGIYIENHTSTVSLTNVTISGNSAENGGGVYNDGVQSWLAIENTIIYGNTATNEEPEFHDTDNTFTATYSLVKDTVFFGAGNLDGRTNDPLFVDPATNDYRLQPNSAAHDKGNTGLYSSALGSALDFNALLDNPIQTDAWGKVRVRGAGIDMGAFELQDKRIASITPPNASAPLTGGGTQVVIEVAGIALDDGVAPDDISNLTVTIAGMPATVDRVEGNRIFCTAGPSSTVAVNGKVEIKYTENGTNTELTGQLLSDFIYYPVVFIENGKWSEYFKWEGQTEDLILPYSGADIYIKANMLQDIDVDMDSITVYPGKAYTLESGKTLDAEVFTLKDDASFLPNGGIMRAEQQNVEHTLAQGRNWYISNPVSNTAGLTANHDWIEQYNEMSHTWENPSGLTAGRGYTIYSAGTGDMQVKFSGKYNDGDIPPFQLTNTPGDKHGFNLVGNPYPSYWRWTEEAAGTNLFSTIWYRTVTDGIYEFWSYNASGNVAAMPGRKDITLTGFYSLGYIPPMQAFWVRVKDEQSTGTLTFTDNHRTHADHGSNQLKSTDVDTETRPLLRLAVHNGSTTDETVIYADRKAKKDFDTYDSDKWFVNRGAEVFTLPASSTRKLVINGFPEITAGTEITLGFQADEGGAFGFYAKEILNLDTLDVFLLDKWRNIQFDLRNGDYNFTSSSVPITDRFSIVFRTPGDNSDLLGDSDNLFAHSGKNGEIIVLLHLQNQQGNDAIVSIFDVAGRKITELPVVLDEHVTLGNFPEGIYILHAGKCVTKVIVKK